MFSLNLYWPQGNNGTFAHSGDQHHTRLGRLFVDLHTLHFTGSFLTCMPMNSISLNLSLTARHYPIDYK